MEVIHRAATVQSHQTVNSVLNILACLSNLRSVGVYLAFTQHVSQVVVDGVRQNEVTISQTLHQGGGTQAVSAVVGEVSFTSHKQTRDGGL